MRAGETQIARSRDATRAEGGGSPRDPLGSSVSTANSRATVPPGSRHRTSAPRGSPPSRQGAGPDAQRSPASATVTDIRTAPRLFNCYSWGNSIARAQSTLPREHGWEEAGLVGGDEEDGDGRSRGGTGRGATKAVNELKAAEQLAKQQKEFERKIKKGYEDQEKLRASLEQLQEQKAVELREMQEQLEETRQAFRAQMEDLERIKSQLEQAEPSSSRAVALRHQISTQEEGIEEVRRNLAEQEAIVEEKKRSSSINDLSGLVDFQLTKTYRFLPSTLRLGEGASSGYRTGNHGWIKGIISACKGSVNQRTALLTVIFPYCVIQSFRSKWISKLVEGDEIRLLRFSSPSSPQNIRCEMAHFFKPASPESSSLLPTLPILPTPTSPSFLGRLRPMGYRAYLTVSYGSE